MSDRSFAAPAGKLDTMTRDELLDLKAEIDRDCIEIKIQLDRAKAGVYARGEYADPDWFQRATTALRINGRKSQDIQRALGKLNTKQKAENIARTATGIPTDHLRFLHAFRSATKFLLSEDEYKEVCDDAEKLVKEKHADAIACTSCNGMEPSHG